MLARVTAFFGLLLSLPAAAATGPCDAAIHLDARCACDVRTLRPLQGAVGMEEVRDKVRKIEAKPNKEWQDLVDDPIKVVRGPGGALFIIDHHHGANAWRLAGRSEVICQLGSRPPFSTEAQFWADLTKDHLVHLENSVGDPVTPAQLPPDLAHTPDDPYRSLAWLVRKESGFCRSKMPQKEFAEFLWADWFRRRPELQDSSVRTSAAGMLPTALKLARGPEAHAVLGYIGDQPPGFKCPKEDP